MKYFLGIDGGGTKTKIIIINEHNEQIFENTTGPSSVDTVDENITFLNISTAVKPFIDQNDIVFSGVFAGLGGIVFEEQKQMLKSMLLKIKGINSSTKIEVQNDMFNALYSGLLFDEGLALICGTGTVAFGKTKDGKTAKCSGWGFKEGELGSGFHLGFEAIRYAIRCLDGRYKKDDFASEIFEYIDLHKTEEIIPLLDQLYLDRTKVASIAPIVSKYANKLHPYATKIIELATDELVLSVRGVLNKLDFKNKKLVIVGSLGNIDGAFKSMLYKKIMALDHQIEIISPIVDPAFSAALYIRKKVLG